MYGWIKCTFACMYGWMDGCDAAVTFNAGEPMLEFCKKNLPLIFISLLLA